MSNIQDTINDLAECLSTEVMMENVYYSYQKSTYNTSSEWVFVLGVLEANSPEEAQTDAMKILSMMSGEGVFHFEDGDKFCEYNSGIPDVLAIAAKGPDVALMNMRQHLLRAH